MTRIPNHFARLNSRPPVRQTGCPYFAVTWDSASFGLVLFDGKLDFQDPTELYAGKELENHLLKSGDGTLDSLDLRAGVPAPKNCILWDRLNGHLYSGPIDDVRDFVRRNKP